MLALACFAGVAAGALNLAFNCKPTPWATPDALKPPLRAWLPIVSQRGDLLQGPALARRARPWVWFPEVLTPQRSCRPRAWSP
jgi:hypothetical protein